LGYYVYLIFKEVKMKNRIPLRADNRFSRIADIDILFSHIVNMASEHDKSLLIPQFYRWDISYYLLFVDASWEKHPG
jgi:hypothetical protein